MLGSVGMPPMLLGHAAVDRSAQQIRAFDILRVNERILRTAGPDAVERSAHARGTRYHAW